MDPLEKFLMVIEYLFGTGPASAIPRAGLEFTISKRTGRLRQVYLDGRLLATLRHDGSIAITPFCAELMLKSEEFLECCVVVRAEASSGIRSSRSIFTRHVVRCGSRIRPGSDVAILDECGRLIGVGRALMSCEMMKSFKSGVAVKIREGVRRDTGRREGCEEAPQEDGPGAGGAERRRGGRDKVQG